MVRPSDNQPAATAVAKTIVVADDESHIRLVVAEKLRSAGYTVIEARDGEEALALVRLHKPDAIITDLQMPYMSGLEMCMQLAADPVTAVIPAVLLTARGHVLEDAAVRATGIRRVMGKPFGVRELLTFVQSMLNGSETGAGPAGVIRGTTSEAA